mgnify:CR=1 FL=1
MGVYEAIVILKVRGGNNMKYVAKSYFLLVILLLQVILPLGQVKALEVNPELVYYTQYKTEKKIEEAIRANINNTFRENFLSLLSERNSSVE